MWPPRPDQVSCLSMQSVLAPCSAAVTDAMAPAKPQPTTSTSTSSVPLIWSSAMSSGGVRNVQFTAAFAPSGLLASDAESAVPALAAPASPLDWLAGAHPAMPAPATPRPAGQRPPGTDGVRRSASKSVLDSLSWCSLPPLFCLRSTPSIDGAGSGCCRIPGPSAPYRRYAASRHPPYAVNSQVRTSTPGRGRRTRAAHFGALWSG